MFNPGKGLSLPESESNTPENKTPGFKPWDDVRDRYWMGHQWSETYQRRKKDNVTDIQDEGDPTLSGRSEEEINADLALSARMYEDTSDYDKDPDRLLKKAKLMVIGSHNSTHEEPDQLTTDQLYIVWFTKVLNNWKALISTSVPGDGLYFEVTYNGDKLETYVDTYHKEDNQVFSHHDS